MNILGSLEEPLELHVRVMFLNIWTIQDYKQTNYIEMEFYP